MPKNPESNDINWVRARLEAIQAIAFINIRRDIISDVGARHASQEGIDTPVRLRVAPERKDWAAVLAGIGCCPPSRLGTLGKHRRLGSCELAIHWRPS